MDEDRRMGCFVHTSFGNSQIVTLLMQENYSLSFPIATTWQLSLPILHEPRVWILQVQVLLHGVSRLSRVFNEKRIRTKK